MSKKLYVGNLSFRTSSKELQDLFSQAGTVESARVVEDRETGRSRGFAFVEMTTPEEAEAAIAQFEGKQINGSGLTVNKARLPESQSGRGRRGYGSKGQSRQERVHIKSGDQEYVVEIKVDRDGQPIEGHAVIFTAAEEEQVTKYFTDLQSSLDRSSKTLEEIN